MSKYTLKDFQQKAKDRFAKIFIDLEYVSVLEELAKNPTDTITQKEASNGRNDPFRIQIDAPTGSGKTVIIGHLAKDYFENYVHIVFSPGAGNLEEQTAKRLASIIGESGVALIDETTFGQPALTGMTYVGNWEQFVSRDNTTGLYKNRAVREGDIRNFFDWVTEIGGRYVPVIITIDEAHYGSGKGLNSITRFLDDIQRHLGYSPFYVEVSATHILTDVRKIKIELQDVIDAGLIRKTVRLNGQDLIEKVDKLTAEQRATYQIEPFLLDFALEKQIIIDTEYIKVDAHEMIAGKKVFQHSLIGIQVPNGPLGNDAILRVETRLRDVHGITRENGLLAVFLSNDKTSNMKDIDSPSSAARVLIYKQGVATGWDCPRAQILVGFRHITSKIFTKQNLGRFLRTTQGKHYENELLDSTYVISNVGDLGQASFGDEIDNDTKYEKQAVLRVIDDFKHVALSSFNVLNISQNHYAFTNQTVVSPADIRKALLTAAENTELWDALDYVYVDSSAQGLIAGKVTTSDLLIDNAGYNLDGTSKKLAVDDAKQLADFQETVSTVISDSDRDYGNNSQVSRTLAKLLIKWYKEAVLKEADVNRVHFGKLRNVITSINIETTKEIRIGEPDWNDIAVEQISLVPTHLASIKSVILTALKNIKSVRVMDDDEFIKNGAPWAERKLVEDSSFIVNTQSSLWLTENAENKVATQFENFYATRIVSSNESYMEGPLDSKSPEDSFVNKAIPSLISSNGNTLAFYYKSLENKTGSFRIGVHGDNDKVSNFFPDFLGETVSVDGVYSPWIVEVKSGKAINDIQNNKTNCDQILLAKIKSMIAIANEYNIKAGVAYEDIVRNEWRIVTEVSKNNNLTTVSFRDYILS